MYNLLVAYNAGEWDQPTTSYGLTRVLRSFTDQRLRTEFQELNDEAIEKLKSYPCLFAYETEQGEGQGARVGWITDIRVRDNSVHLRYRFDASFPVVRLEDLLRLTWELDIQNVELTNTHWALKNVDLFSVLIDAGVVARENVANLAQEIQETIPPPVADVIVRPTVFRLPNTGIENDLVSVMMPFAPIYASVLTALAEACASLGLRCVRADAVWEETEIIQDVFSLIYKSKVVICDFTSRNANVFYEAGIAHTLGRSVIPIAQSRDDVPFDLAHHRYQQYTNTVEGLSVLQEQIIPRLRTLTAIR